MNKVLIIDDEEKLRNLLARILRLEGFEVNEAASLKSGYKLIERDEPDVILCDVKLPDGNGVEFIKTIRAKFPISEIILLTAYGNIPDGIQAMKNGAFDYITKGDDNDRLLPLVNKALEKVDLKKKVASLEKHVGKKYLFESIIGTSKSIKDATYLARKVAATDTTVLLLGETGTGKEVFAQSIHNAGARSNNPFIAINCSAFSRELLESELFGHKAGAFTGAVKDKRGLIEEANGGTLFLDEIGEMSIDLQSKLLRALETSEFIKIGNTKTTKVNVRFIAATNRNLKAEINEGKFREDLFYRLNVFGIQLPPLRERKEDIVLLVKYFIELFSVKTNKIPQGIDGDAMEILKNAYWKGNIRELKNIIERTTILSNSDTIRVSDLPLDILPADETNNFLDLNFIEKNHIQKVLHHTRNNKTETARLLNIGLTTLYRKMEEYNIPK